MSSPPLEDEIDVVCRLLERDIVWCACFGYQRADTTWEDPQSQHKSGVWNRQGGSQTLFIYDFPDSRIPNIPGLTGQPSEL
jgi:hypothetical protein